MSLGLLGEEGTNLFHLPPGCSSGANCLNIQDLWGVKHLSALQHIIYARQRWQKCNAGIFLHLLLGGSLNVWLFKIYSLHFNTFILVY